MCWLDPTLLHAIFTRAHETHHYTHYCTSHTLARSPCARNGRGGPATVLVPFAIAVAGSGLRRGDGEGCTSSVAEKALPWLVTLRAGGADWLPGRVRCR